MLRLPPMTLSHRHSRSRCSAFTGTSAGMARLNTCWTALTTSVPTLGKGEHLSCRLACHIFLKFCHLAWHAALPVILPVMHLLWHVSLPAMPPGLSRYLSCHVTLLVCNVTLLVESHYLSCHLSCHATFPNLTCRVLAMIIVALSSWLVGKLCKKESIDKILRLFCSSQPHHL